MHVQEEAHLHQRSTCNKSQSRSRLDYNDVLFISIILTSQKQHKGSSDIHSAVAARPPSQLMIVMSNEQMREQQLKHVVCFKGH